MRDRKGLTKHKLHLLSELMKNSRRSDRELARALGISQPTVSRLLADLKMEGIVRENTIIPNFNKLGYHVFALTFFRWKPGVEEKDKDGAMMQSLRQAASAPNNVIVIERGIGLDYDSFMASFHEDYHSYNRLRDYVRANPYVDSAHIGSFLVDLDEQTHYRYLTLSTLAKHLIEQTGKKEYAASTLQGLPRSATSTFAKETAQIGEYVSKNAKK